MGTVNPRETRKPATFETRREYVPVGSGSASMPHTVSKAAGLPSLGRFTPPDGEGEGKRLGGQSQGPPLPGSRFGAGMRQRAPKAAASEAKPRFCVARLIGPWMGRINPTRSFLSVTQASQIKSESTDKPGSVVGNHSSGFAVTGDLKRPTRRRRGQRHGLPIWSCSGWGLPSRSMLPPARCALTAPFHPYLRACAAKAVCFLLHFP